MPGTAPAPLELDDGDADAPRGIGPPGIGPHTSSIRHDGVLTLLQDPTASASGRSSADGPSDDDPKASRKREKTEAKRAKDLEKWRSKAEKDAKAAAAKQGTAEAWEDFMLETPKQLLSEEELAKHRWLGTVPLFRGLHSGKFISVLASKLTTFEVSAGEFFIEKGDIGHEMYFVVSGTCDVLLERDAEAQPVASREPGEFVGETALLEQTPRNSWVRARTHLTLYTLSSAGLEEVITHFPSLRVIIKLPMEDIEQRQKLIDQYVLKLQMMISC